MEQNRMVAQHENPVAHLNDYELHHLVTHLKGAERYEDVHRLLALETSNEHNAWYKAKEAVWATADYIADIDLAWIIAEEAVDIGLQCQYALILTSLKSLMANIPPALIASLVKKHIWPVETGLTYAKYMSIPEQPGEARINQAKLFTTFVPYLPRNFLPEIIQLVQEIRIDDPSFKSIVTQSALEKIATQCAELGYVDEAFLAIDAIQNHDTQQKLLSKLPIILAKEHHYEKAVIALGECYWNLKESLPLFPDDFLQKLLLLAYHIERKWRRDETLAAFVIRFSKVGSFEQAFEILQSIDAESYRSDALTQIYADLPPTYLQRSLDVIYALSDAEIRAKALIAVLPYVPIEQTELLVAKTLSVVFSINHAENRIFLLTKLFAHLSANDKLLVQQRFHDFINRSKKYAKRPELCSKIFPAIAHCFQEPEKKALLSDSLLAAQNTNIFERFQTIISLSSFLDEPDKSVALSSALKSVLDVELVEESFYNLLNHLPKHLKQEAIAAIKSIRQTDFQAKAIIHLLPLLNESERLHVLKDIMESTFYADLRWVMEIIAPYLPEDLLKEAVEIIKRADKDTRALAFDAGWIFPENLYHLAPYLPEDILREVLTHQLVPPNRATRELKAVLITRLAELGYPEEALKEARKLSNRYRASALEGMAPYLSESLFFQALQEA